MRRLRWAVLPAMLLLVGCAAILGGTQRGGGVARAEVRREAAPAADSAQLAGLASENTAFALDLYHTATQDQQGNFIFSPYSMSLAFAMVYGGARGETERQIAETLHYTLPQDQLHPTFNALDIHLRGLAEPSEQGQDDSGDLRLNIANAVWGQQDLAFLPEYLDLLARNYGVGLRLLDFEAAPDAARQEINGWVAEETEDRIKDLIPEGVIDPSTRMVLVNAIYFYGAWSEQFSESATQDGPFTTPDGEQVTVPMMQQGGLSLLYAQGEGFRAAELPYGSAERTAMLILLPDADTFADFEASLDAARFQEIRAGLAYQAIGTLKLPRFEFESTLDLVPILQSMGMMDPFEDTADFSGMTTETALKIGAAIHKANITVDEEGTEAAAATAIIMEEAAAMIPENPVDFIVDRPFIFAIVDRDTGSVLFLGRVTDPSQ